MKKILLSLFVGLIGLINFGYCETVKDLIEVVGEGDNYIVSSSWQSLKTLNSSEYGIYCLNVLSFQGDTAINFGYTTQANYGRVLPGDYLTFYLSSTNSYRNMGCISVNQPNLWIGLVRSTNITIDYELYKLDDLLAENLPLMTSLQCQTEYNLIPVSSIDQNYCVNNGLCPSGGGDCPVCPGSGDNWSALYINDIQHLGKPIINITFPDYLDWDYTTTENEFNLDIVGYPVDTEYIDGIIRTQNYKPTSEDFTQLVGMLAPYSKYLLFLLFIFIVWAWIKKPFKSKKL